MARHPKQVRNMHQFALQAPNRGPIFQITGNRGFRLAQRHHLKIRRKKTYFRRSFVVNDPASVRKLAYRHSGRFDVRALPQLDGRPNVNHGDQFNYRLTGAGEAHKNCRDPVPAAEFQAMLDSVEANLKKMGHKIFSGHVEVAPFSKGKMTACNQCNYLSICRIDPWTHTYRVLNRIAEPEESDD